MAEATRVTQVRGEVLLPATKSVFLSYVNKKQHFKPLKQISTVTNELILELLKLRYENASAVTFAAFYRWVRDLYGDSDSSTLLNGTAVCIEGIDIHSDEVWAELIQSNSTDENTQEVLQVLFNAFSLTTQRLLVDHLPNGIYHNVTDEEIIRETCSVPTTNVSPERDFAVLDRLLREKPNAQLISLEAIILFAHNKTSKWVAELSCDEREKLFKAARSLAPSFKEKFKARRQEIESRRKRDMEKRIEDNARKDMKIVKEREMLTKQIEENGGLWMKEEEMETALASLSTQKKKKEALKLQINFQNKVLKEKHSRKDVFKFSHNGRQFSVAELKLNLLLLMGVSEGSNNQLSQVTLNPELLVGKKIKHCFEVGEELVWYTGTVLSMNPETMEFEVQYDDEDNVCFFTLLDDISSGDLVLL
uniref:Uncharacterized protein n=1 Tax=Amphimedon queenslandica TaxID=400682 RepID=A0A1X7UAB5_AMPQE